MLKVCHMTSAHGAEDVRIFHKECVSLAKAGYDVYLVERGDSYEKDGVKIVGVGDIPSSRLKRMSRGARSVYKAALALDCDLYHFHDPELLPYALKLKKKGKKVIFDSHEFTRRQILIKPYIPAPVAKLISFLYGLYEDHVISKIDGVIIPCPVDGVFPFKAKNGAFIDNVPKLEEFYDKYRPGAEKEPNTVCYIGSLTYARGVQHLVEAAHRAGCRALFGGNLSPEDFKKKILDMPESENSEFLGYLNREQVLDTIMRSNVGVSTLLNVAQYNNPGNLSTKVYEYMSMSVPVILTRNEFDERMIETYKFGKCVDPENIEEFASVLRELLD
ncbi:MAG: glycosyltransferase, partial [Oscillospiraceae bacterium]|nr:glycosyltransferase [Oscillospiraceae bacterium]